MLETLVETILVVLIPLCELMGIFVVAVSALAAFGRYLKGLVTRHPADGPLRGHYHSCRITPAHPASANFQ